MGFKSGVTHSLKNSSSLFAYFSAYFLNDLSLINAMSVLDASAFIDLSPLHPNRREKGVISRQTHGSIMSDLVFESSYCAGPFHFLQFHFSLSLMSA